jgi:hypothetical protein
MPSFVSTDDRGNFVLDGRPWFLHGATYYGRRPGTCGADWTGEHWDFNAPFVERDLARIRQLGLNTVSLFVPGRYCFDGLDPVEERFARFESLLDAVREAGLRAIVFSAGGISREAWCEAHGVDPGEELWHPAVRPEAEKLAIASATALRRPYADRPEILGWSTGVGRFFRFKFTVPPVRSAWSAWLRERFDDDLARAGALLDFEPDEDAWDRVRMPTEMEPYFNQHNLRSFEFALMQQVLSRRATARIVAALREVAPRQLLIESMEGCCFSTGHLNTIVPELCTADALYVEYYHWEGLRAYHIQSGEELRWMAEPIADKPSVEIVNAAGYVQMLTRLMQRSGRPVIMCHGTDIGEKRRGVFTEDEQADLMGRYNTFFRASGGSGIVYWCWTDDECSKTYTRELGFEYTRDTPIETKRYSQAGETMGILRYDGSERPVADVIRRFAARADVPPADAPHEVLVLFPCPLFQSLYRYRANLTGYALFTSLARQGILADAAMTSAAERPIAGDDLSPYRLVVVGAGEYLRDHAGAPAVLRDYVERGGALLLPLGFPDRLQDEYLEWRPVPALQHLSGVAALRARDECARLDGIASPSAAFDSRATPSWELAMDEPAFFTVVEPVAEAEVLVAAGPGPLLYRHPIGEGTVYVFTWHLDVLLYRGSQLDYPGDDWDWLWRGLATELDLRRDTANPIAALLRTP